MRARLSFRLRCDIGLHVFGLVSEREATVPGLTTDGDETHWRIRLYLNIKF